MSTKNQNKVVVCVFHFLFNHSSHFPCQNNDYYGNHASSTHAVGKQSQIKELDAHLHDILYISTRRILDGVPCLMNLICICCRCMVIDTSSICKKLNVKKARGKTSRQKM
jgi:hypothetical protein